MAKLIATRLRVIEPDAADQILQFDLPREPGYHRLAEIIEPLLGGASLEQVSVLADFDGGTKFEPLDMFVDGEGLLKNLPRNKVATEHYRRANQMGKSSAPKARDPEMLSYIAGTAILFDRRVWF